MLVVNNLALSVRYCIILALIIDSNILISGDVRLIGL